MKLYIPDALPWHCTRSVYFDRLLNIEAHPRSPDEFVTESNGNLWWDLQNIRVEVVDIPANNKAFMKAIIFSQELGRDHQDFYFCFFNHFVDWQLCLDDQKIGCWFVIDRKVVSVLQTGVEIVHLAS
jgi:hypothetical protein